MSSLLEVGYTDVILLAILAYVVYIMFFKKATATEPERPSTPPLPDFKMQDMTVDELRKYNGVDDERILVAVAGRIYDVTRGKSFYGPGSAYETLAGHDATRSFALFDAKAVKDEHDDWDGLKEHDLHDALEWEERFRAKYPYVGRLLKPAEEPQDYQDEVATVKFGGLKPLKVNGTSFVEA